VRCFSMFFKWACLRTWFLRFSNSEDPTEVSRFVFNTSVYLVEHGDVIADGHSK